MVDIWEMSAEWRNLLIYFKPSSTVVPNFFGTRDLFRVRQISMDGGGGGGIVQAAMRAMGSKGEQRGATGRGRWSFALFPTTHLLLCSPVPNTAYCYGVGDPSDLIYYFVNLMVLKIKISHYGIWKIKNVKK